MLSHLLIHFMKSRYAFVYKTICHQFFKTFQSSDFFTFSKFEGFQGIECNLSSIYAAENGEMLYPSYDTHWNQAGHELVGTEISTFIEQNCP